MNMKHIILAGAAIAALSTGAVAARADTKAEEDAVTRQLNLDQLEAARSGTNWAPAPDGDDMDVDQVADDAADGQGGPYHEAPPQGLYDQGMPTPDEPEESAPDDAEEPPPGPY